ncbi:Clavaminate synthase-like protein [Punctularia strigosozonata HHB-11173 SS5]|uniref:Clavaminate synthase-like protein n=1 Tax=Punctularia strigosozonata (strain HHB-11173) TaxID=741275 RepID=UPI00044162C8|nr:Clavaminate synthase-like protein [Punctularia strigosozonata HHB-11173 SS5]EIN14715.1 Clavaminate synthase-like protein [Punctularia strigosozonata HHB-11173 SS5]
MRPSLRLFAPFAIGDSSLTVKSLGAAFPYRWLRDSCQCASCVHPSTRQKLHRTTDVSPDVAPVPGGVTPLPGGDGVSIEWRQGHRSSFGFDFLERYSAVNRRQAFHRDLDRIPWDRARLQHTDAKLYQTYADLKTESGLLAAISQLWQYGLLFVTGVPTAETSDERCEVRALASRFSEVRATFYGETWDVKNVQQSKNIAYTDLDLGLHMDLLYFEHPPRFQILHCLRNRVRGGASYFVDALHAASTLSRADPEGFRTLTETPVSFHYINDGHHLHFEHPTIELFPASDRIAHINYSPPFQAPLPLSTPDAFYPAFRRFADLLDRPEARFEYLLREGDAVLFDNRRVLHARTAFHDPEEDAGEVQEDMTNRWLKGCYIEADAVFDRGRILRTKLEG